MVHHLIPCCAQSIVANDCFQTKVHVCFRDKMGIPAANCLKLPDAVPTLFARSINYLDPTSTIV